MQGARVGIHIPLCFLSPQKRLPQQQLHQPEPPWVGITQPSQHKSRGLPRLQDARHKDCFIPGLGFGGEGQEVFTSLALDFFFFKLVFLEKF